MKTILVFKTTIAKKKDVKNIRPFLNKLMDKNSYWNFDLEDCDNILRVESQCLKANLIIEELKCNGFKCEELL